MQSVPMSMQVSLSKSTDMNEKVIEQMGLLCTEDCTDLQYDWKALEDYEGTFIWCERSEGKYTDLIKLDFDKYCDYLSTERGMYMFAQGGDIARGVLDYRKNDDTCNWYIHYEGTNNLVEVTWQTCNNLYSGFIKDVLGTLKHEGFVMPTDFKIPIHFGEHCFCYVMEQVRYAQQHGDNSLLECLRRLRRYRKVSDYDEIVIYRDYEDRSFQWCHKSRGGNVEINGGLIFHGYPSEGYRENGSVQLEPQYGWSIHT